MPRLANLTLEVMKYACNPKGSRENFLNAFLGPYIKAGRITNKSGDLLYLDAARTSRLLAGLDDVPQALREALGRTGLKEMTAESMSGFVQAQINPAGIGALSNHLIEMIRDDPMTSLPDQEEFIRDSTDINMLLTDLLMQSVAECNVTKSGGEIIWRSGANSAEVIAGDLFRYGFGNRKKRDRNIVVIPVNTAFDTHVTRTLEGDPHPVVSENTIHGQWLSRMEQSGEDMTTLDRRIMASLTSLGYKPARAADATNSKRDQYEIGSVAVIETHKAIYFLLAISTFDEENHAHSSVADIESAIRSLLQVYDRIGQGYDMYLPLLGTGRSRTGMSVCTAYRLLRKTLVDNSKLIQGHIFLVVRGEEMAEIEEE